MPNEFRCAFFTDRYEETLDFYKTKLGCPVGEQWDRADDDKGTVFILGSGMIEVLTMPQHDEGWVWDKRPPQGIAVVVELDDVNAFYEKLKQTGVVMAAQIADMEWGHRSFQIVDPNGLNLYFYSELSKLKS